MPVKHAQITINDVEYDLHLARIEGTSLGTEDHGVFTASLHLLYGSGGSGQSAGGYVLDSREVEGDYSNYTRRGTGYGHDFIMQMINTVGVDTWEDVKGKTIYVLKAIDDDWGRILGIANLYDPEQKNLVFEDHKMEFFSKWPEGR